MKFLVSASILVAGLAAPVVAQDEAPADFMSAFRQVIPHVMSGDWEAALAPAETALPLADTPMNQYRIRHMLTDINARLGNWEDAGRYALEASQVIHGDEELAASRMVMASHMAAEEARAAMYLGDPERVAEANARMITDHPDAAPDWTSHGNTGARHADGLECPLFISDYLRFDVYGGAEGNPACLYWNHADIGIRLIQGSDAVGEAERLGERYADMETSQFEIVTTGTGDNAPLTSWNLGTSRPGTPEQFAMTLEHPLQPWTVTVQYPADQETAARDILLQAFVNQQPD